MPEYRRYYIPGGTYFFTVVTASRAPILVDQVDLLRQKVAEARQARPFDIVAAVILPDHMHMIWSLPKGDDDYAIRWSAIKANFTREYLRQGGKEQNITVNAKQQERRGVWQPRFIEHTIRDEDDLAAHIDYIHFNPVKHGYAYNPIDWPYSSLHRYVRQGILTEDWGVGFDDEPGANVNDGIFE